MPITAKQSHLTAGQFHDLSGNKRDSFAEKYNRFKKASNCKDLAEVIRSTESLVQKGAPEKDLFYIREGLETLRDQYELTLRKDHPIISFVRQLIPVLFKSHDRKVKSDLSQMIQDVTFRLALEHSYQKIIGGGFKSENESHNRIYRLIDDPQFKKEAEEFFGNFWQGGSPKLENFSKFFQEKIMDKYGKIAGLGPKTERHEAEAFLIAASIAAKEASPKVFAYFNSKNLEDFPVGNESIAYDMYIVVKIFGRGRGSFYPKDHPELKRDHVERNIKDVQLLLQSKASPSYQDSDKEEIQHLLNYLKDEDFKREAVDFVRRIPLSPFEDPIVEMQRLMKEFQFFVERVNQGKTPDKQISQEKRLIALKAAFLADPSAKYLYPSLLKIAGMLEKAPALQRASFQAPEEIEAAYQRLWLFRQACDFACRIDPLNLLKRKEEEFQFTESAGKSEIEKKAAAVEKELEENLLSEDPKEKKEAEWILGLMKDTDFQSDAEKCLSELAAMDRLAGSLSRMEIIGRAFHDLIIKKHAGKIGADQKATGGDEQYTLSEACLLAAREHLPDFFRMLREIDQDEMTRVIDNNYKMMALNIISLCNNIEGH